MMRTFLNELSFNGCFAEPNHLVDELLEIYDAHRKQNLQISISRFFVNRPAVNSTSVYNAINSAEKTKRALILGWISKNGPFLEDDRLNIENDLWWYEGTDVTDLGLGEAARRRHATEHAISFSSSIGCGGGFDKNTLEIIQGFEEEIISSVDLPNAWSTDGLSALIAEPYKEPATWADFVEHCVGKFEYLSIDRMNFADGLGKHPFNLNVVRRGLALLGVLDQIAKGIDPDGGLSEPAMNLFIDHFQGRKSWFSDETPADDSIFWFRDTNSGGDKKIYCSWHGKVKTPQFRVHFEWPIPPGQNHIKVLYFGEKLTKR